MPDFSAADTMDCRLSGSDLKWRGVEVEQYAARVIDVGDLMDLLAIKPRNVSDVDVPMQKVRQLFIFPPLEQCLQNTSANQSDDAIASAVVVNGTRLSGGEANQHDVNILVSMQHDACIWLA